MMAKKILHINKSDRTGGAAVAALRLVNAQRKAGLASSILVEEKKSDNSFVLVTQQGTLAKWFAFGRFVLERLFFFPHEASKAVRFAFSPAVAGTNLSKHSAIQESDLLHFHWFNQGFLSLHSFSKLLALPQPVVWTLHDMWSFTGGCHYSGTCTAYEEACGNCHLLKHPSNTDLSYRTLQKKGFIAQKENLTVVTCSEWLAEMARASSALRGVKVVSIPNAIDTTYFAPSSKQIAKTKLGLDPHKPVLLFGAANLEDKRKGFLYLKAALIFLTTLPHEHGLQLLFFGKAETTQFANFGLPYLHFPYANTQQIVELYNAANFLVIPSLEDNLPNTIMEALACGTPVVAFETGGIPEMIRHEETGFLAPIRNTEFLAEGIRWALNTGEKEQAAARNFALDNYSESVVAQRYAGVYAELLSKPSPIL